MNATGLFVALAMVTSGQPAGPQDAIWIEGENPSATNVAKHGWYDSVKKDVLSGGDWLSHFSNARAGSAEYNFAVKNADEYTLWLRANPVKTRLSFRLDQSRWQSIDLEDDQRGFMNIAADNRPDLRFIAWVKVGKFHLSTGRHTIDFKMDSPNQNHGAIDCFVFTRIPFVPSGTRKPMLQSAQGKPDEWFPVVFDDDPLSSESATDVGRLVESPAGKHGFLKRKRDRVQFENSEQPIKFWAVNAHPLGDSDEEMIHSARWLRKHGVNLVRQHTVMDAVGLLNDDGDFDANRMDRYDRWFAALKEQGIYTTWSVVYPHHGAFLRRSDGYDSKRFAELDRADTHRDGKRQPIVVNDYINFDRDLQDIVLRYFEKLLNHKNPHTGLAYKDDPALAIVEFQNESNLFFHTLNNLRNENPPTFAQWMRKAFFDFVKDKYRTKEAVAKAWNNRWDRDDRWEQGELGLMGAFHWGSDGPLHEFSGQFRRTGDYIEFLTRLQRGYYERREKELRGLGFQGVTVTTAWRSGGPGASMANLYADTAADMIDRHNYFGGGAGGHVVVEGAVNNETHLDKPGHGLLGLALFQVEDKPFAVSEWSMMPPAPYKAEAAPLYALYGMGLQGWDASYHFACGAGRMGDGWPNLRKYVTQTPHYMGQFPALALAVHENHIKEGEAAAARRLSLEEVFSGKDVLGQSLSGGGHDDKKLAGRLVTPPEAVAIGRVTIAFEGGPDPTVDFDRYWDRKSKTLTSTTGELVWDYGDRIVEVRAPRTQGVIGFAAGKTTELPAAEVSVKTPFVSLLLTALDQRPIARSTRILITAMARDKQTGAVFNDDWSRLSKVGGPPLLMEPVQADVKLTGKAPRRVRPLDVYGVPKPSATPEPKISADGRFTIDGRFRTYYYLVER